MRTPHLLHQTLRAALVLATGGALACGDTSPLSAPSPRLSPQLAGPARSRRGDAEMRLRISILRRSRPLRADEVACRVVDPARSNAVRITLAQAGLQVTFPVGSVPATTRICLKAHAGSLLTYSFEPHGLQFGVPIQVHQDLRGTTAYGDAAIARTLLGGYLANGVEADVDSRGVGNFAETFTTATYDEQDEITDSRPARAIFRTKHFSGYALASGLVDTVTPLAP